MSELKTMVPKVSTSLEEQETSIVYTAADNGRATVYTAYGRDLKRYWKLYKQHPDEVEIVRDDKYGTEFSMPEEWFKARPKRKVSPEAAAKRLEALQRARQSVQQE